MGSHGQWHNCNGYIATHTSTSSYINWHTKYAKFKIKGVQNNYNYKFVFTFLNTKITKAIKLHCSLIRTVTTVIVLATVEALSIKGVTISSYFTQFKNYRNCNVSGLHTVLLLTTQVITLCTLHT